MIDRPGAARSVGVSRADARTSGTSWAAARLLFRFLSPPERDRNSRPRRRLAVPIVLTISRGRAPRRQDDRRLPSAARGEDLASVALSAPRATDPGSAQGTPTGRADATAG